MRRTLTLLCNCLVIFANSQNLQNTFSKPDTNFRNKIRKPSVQLRTMELCNNGIDDDGNGLRDCEDYDCYFSSNTCNCVPSNTIWIATEDFGLYWVNLQTGQESVVGTLGVRMTDITWSPGGKLYGISGSGLNIYEINPATAQTTLKATEPGYNFANAMTCDNQGNFYIAAQAISPGGGFRIIKYNLATGLKTIVADLGAAGLVSGGDLAFLNGDLYCACNANVIAKINVNTGLVQGVPIQGIPSNTTIFGIVSTADGSLYLSSAISLYKLNPVTMNAVLAHNCTSSLAPIYGLANYNDNCNSTPCLATVTVSSLANPPYCIDQGPTLIASGAGLSAAAGYQWISPGGSVIAGPTINATQSGTYKVVYSEDPACRAWDSMVIKLEGAPVLNLGLDTIVCPGTSIVLKNQAAGTGSYLWQDASIQNSLSVNNAGIYWVQLTGACGISKDTISIQQGYNPIAALGPDISICPYDDTLIKNNTIDPGYTYRWSSGGTGSSISISQPGMFWLEVGNVCGKARDTIVVNRKGSECDCFLYVPTAFTPNGDGKNDVFRVNSNCRISGELAIYNRWGQVVFKTKDLSEGWNGRISSQLQPNAVYVYLLKYRFRNYPEQLQEKGTFVLIH